MENMRATMVAISNLKPEVVKGKYISQVCPPLSSLQPHMRTAHGNTRFDLEVQSTKVINRSTSSPTR